MSACSIRPVSPAQPSSTSVTTTTVSTSPPQSSLSASGAGTGPGADTTTGEGGNARSPTTTTTTGTSLSSPVQPPPAPARSLPANPAGTLPTATQQAQIAQARTALVASLGNALDTELQTRASLLHGNAAAIERQTRDVESALAGLRREDEKLQKVLNEGSRQVKELGDVQNWAERLERDFLVLEETLRLAEEGSGSESGSWSGSESGSWDGSVDGEGDVRMDGDEMGLDGSLDRLDKGKGKQVATDLSDAMDVDPARVPLPPDADIQESGPSAAINEARPTEPSNTAGLPSPGTTSWFKRFVWRGSS